MIKHQVSLNLNKKSIIKKLLDLNIEVNRGLNVVKN